MHERREVAGARSTWTPTAVPQQRRSPEDGKLFHVWRNTVMKALSLTGLLFAAAIFATLPLSPQVTPRGVELTVDQAQARYGHYRRVHRRVYRRGYRYGY